MYRRVKITHRFASPGAVLCSPSASLFETLQNEVSVYLDMILKEACSQGANPESASCVQRFDDSRNSAIRITYRSLPRSSSSQEPRYPLLRVVLLFLFFLCL